MRSKNRNLFKYGNIGQKWISKLETRGAATRWEKIGTYLNMGTQVRNGYVNWKPEEL